MKAALRVARPTDDLDTVATMYRIGLGFEILGSFADHQGFDGVMLGHPDLAWPITSSLPTTAGTQSAGRRLRTIS